MGGAAQEKGGKGDRTDFPRGSLESRELCRYLPEKKQTEANSGSLCLCQLFSMK